MALLETKHTRSRLNIIKEQLTKALSIFSVMSMLAFIGYYIYLITKNYDNVFYFTIY